MVTPTKSLPANYMSLRYKLAKLIPTFTCVPTRDKKIKTSYLETSPRDIKTGSKFNSIIEKNNYKLHFINN